MKKLAVGTLMLVALALTTGCNTIVNPGYAGILVKQTGSNRGVQDYPVRTGRVFYNPMNEDVIEFPVFTQTVQWTKSVTEGNPVNEEIVFTNKDQMQIAVDAALSYQLEVDKVPEFYVKFRTDDMKNFTNNYMHNVARDCFNEHAGAYTIQEIMGDNAKFLADVRKCLQDQMTPIGITVTQFGLIGAPRPPGNVIAAINNAATAQRLAIQKQNELAQVQADAAKQVAASEGQAKAKIAEAEGIAKANQIVSASINANILEKQRLDNQSAALYKWDGRLPDVVAGQGGNLLMQIPTGKE